jgi:hypothetical protein
MMTQREFAAEPGTLPTQTGRYLTDLVEARGKQDLFTRQSPQKLATLGGQALVASAFSSNRIEWVEVDHWRVARLLFCRPALGDRDEEEVRGCRDALKLIHELSANLGVSEKTITRPHKPCRGGFWDAGACKEKDEDIIQTYADGRSRVRFNTVTASSEVVG